ncbi:MAG: MerR family transcriptional regulator [Porphyromonas sp.]|nr:MerR family transcriptional regulator [Porphyromonas sp.]
MALKKERVKKLYYSISEVSKLLGESETTLRYWEEAFPHTAPKRSQGGTRRYTEDKIESLRTVQRLVRQEGMTLEGAKVALAKRRTSLERREQAISTLRQALDKLQRLHTHLEQSID